MKLSDEYKRLVERKSKKIKYDMQNVNGGFSDGVEIHAGSTSDIMNISVDIYGGNQNSSIAYNVPPSISELQEAFIAARKTGDPVSGDIKSELEEYYGALRRAISLEVVRLMQEFDTQTKEAISLAVGKINQKYK